MIPQIRLSSTKEICGIEKQGKYTP